MTVTIYHNPACGTSRNVLAMIRASGEEPVIIEYLKSPPSRETLVALLAAMGARPRDILREKGTPYAELGLGDPTLSDDDLLNPMMAHLILINRPIVMALNGTGLCRPSERVLVLPDWWGDFHWWPLIPMGLGLVMTFLARTSDDFGTGVMITLFGLWFVVASNGFFGLTWKNSWPLALVAAGLGTVMHGIAGNWLPETSKKKKERRDG